MSLDPYRIDARKHALYTFEKLLIFSANLLLFSS